MYEGIAQPTRTELTLFTDALIIRGSVETRQRRITDILNLAEHPFLVLDEVTIDEHGSSGAPMSAPYAQINLDAILFAIADNVVEPNPLMRVTKAHERVLISIPPFSVSGTIHLRVSEVDKRAALGELTEPFVPVTEASYWSEQLREARRQAVVVAVNHRRVQYIAPHHEQDLWAGLDQPRPAEGAVQPDPTDGT